LGLLFVAILLGWQVALVSLMFGVFTLLLGVPLLGLELLLPLGVELALLVSFLLLLEEESDRREDLHRALDHESAQSLERGLVGLRLSAGHLHHFVQDRVDRVYEAEARGTLAVVEECAYALRVAVTAEEHSIVLELVVLVAQVLDYQQAAHEPGLGQDSHFVERLLALDVRLE